MNILILEDEPFAAKRLEIMLKDMNASYQILSVIDTVSGAVKWFSNHQMPDLAFFDIHLADGISFEIFNQVSIECPIIFTTAYDEYALQAFKVNSIDYLLKPFDFQDLQKAIEKLLRLRRENEPERAIEKRLSQLENLIKEATSKVQYRTRFLVESRGQMISIPVQSINYFYSTSKITTLVSNEGRKFIIPETLEEIETQLNPNNFFRLNRWVIGSASSIEAIEASFGGKLKVTLSPRIDDEVIVSKEKATPFKEWLGR
ncbi:MAG: LytTR family DNA-binding domain-containing protein [Chloroherpetonaceae bacterium]|nr:LytTR family DNA-binding domain-containing protein [Chloroherpetonaceae bacterium]